MKIDISLIPLIVAICIWTIIFIWHISNVSFRAKNKAQKIAGNHWLVQNRGVLVTYDVDGNLKRAVLCLQNRETKRNVTLVFGSSHPSLWLVKTLNGNDVVNLIFVESPKFGPKQAVSSYLLVEKWAF